MDIRILHYCSIEGSKMNIINQLILTKKTVYRYNELISLFPDYPKKALDQFLFRAKKSRLLLNPSRYIRTLPVYKEFELASLLKPQSYISLETVLYDAGAIFQYYGSTVTNIADKNNEYIIDNKHYIYKKIKQSLLANNTGIRQHQGYSIATPERALCDAVYLIPNYGIDNPQAFNLIRMNQILPLYPKSTAKYIYKLLQKDE